MNVPPGPSTRRTFLFDDLFMQTMAVAAEKRAVEASAEKAIAMKNAEASKQAADAAGKQAVAAAADAAKAKAQAAGWSAWD